MGLFEPHEPSQPRVLLHDAEQPRVLVSEALELGAEAFVLLPHVHEVEVAVPDVAEPAHARMQRVLGGRCRVEGGRACEPHRALASPLREEEPCRDDKVEREQRGGPLTIGRAEH